MAYSREMIYHLHARQILLGKQLFPLCFDPTVHSVTSRIDFVIKVG